MAQRAPESRPTPLASTVAALVDEIARTVALRVVEHLRSTDLPGYVDQSSSPLGRRRHIAAVRSGRLRGLLVGRRYLARREDVDAYVARSAVAAVEPQQGRRPVDALADELGFTGRRSAG